MAQTSHAYLSYTLSLLLACQQLDTQIQQPTMPNCFSCGEFGPPHRFPKPPEGSECTHPTRMCAECWQGWLASQLDTVRPNMIRCAECDELIGQVDMQLRADAETYER